MRAYAALFRMRVIGGLQYRASALSGVATNIFWTMMELMIYLAFYKSSSAPLPMGLQETASYIWIREAFLALFYPSLFDRFDREVFDSITSGAVSYELCRPLSLYGLWFTSGASSRIAMVLLRCAPILVIGALMPAPYSLAPPASAAAALLFVPAVALGLCVVTALCTIVYTTMLYTLSAAGVRAIASSLLIFLSGGVIPLPFMPDGVRRVLGLLPFGAIQDVPLRIYTGDLAGQEALLCVALQAFWAAALMLAGRAFLRRALCRAVVQGG